MVTRGQLPLWDGFQSEKSTLAAQPGTSPDVNGNTIEGCGREVTKRRDEQSSER